MGQEKNPSTTGQQSEVPPNETPEQRDVREKRDFPNETTGQRDARREAEKAAGKGRNKTTSDDE